MKISKQIIAVFGSALLFFAPLAQAQQRSGNVGLAVIPSGLSVAGTNIHFGDLSVADLPGDGIVSIFCSPGDDPISAPSQVSGDHRSCGNITVNATTSNFDYRLDAEVTVLADINNSSNNETISPDLSLYKDGGFAGGLQSFTPTNPGSTTAFSVNDTNPVPHNYIVTGQFNIASQPPGQYQGTYTITAVVVE